jgi:hypothetical protein
LQTLLANHPELARATDILRWHTSLPEGTQVKVFDTRTAGDITWYRIGFAGGEGWASAEFITLP